MHWFPFYPSDFIGSTLDCSYDEATTYAWILIVYYQSGGGLPADRQRLYRMLRCESIEQKQVVESVMRFFVERDGRIWHERAERTIAEQNAKHHRRVEAGKYGGLAKASNARALIEQCSSNQNQNQNQITSKHLIINDVQPASNATPLCKMKPCTSAFDEFWKAYPRRQGKGAAQRSWEKLNPSSDLIASILASVAAQTASAQWIADNGKYIPHPSTWLNQRRWEDDVETTLPRRLAI